MMDAGDPGDFERLSRALEVSSARYDDLYDFSPVAFCTLNQKGELLEVNLSGAKLLGADRSKLPGTSLLDFVHLEDHQAFRDHLGRCQTSQRQVVTDLRLSVKLGSPTTVEMYSAPMKGQGKFFRTVLTDVTEQRKAEDALRNSVRIREDFLTIISHDLRNPLNTITMGTEMLLRRVDPDERRETGRRQLESIKLATRRMTKLLSDLLDLSSMDAGHLVIEQKPHGASQLMQSAIEVMAPLASEKSIALKLAPATAPLVAFCDRERVVQVLMVLITNALKFTPAGRSITLDARAHSHGIVMSVTDTGEGMQPEQLPTLFRPYWQVDKTIKIGTGLGLSIAKGIVECHGGRIWAESARGQGSTFSFTLPTSTLAPVESKGTLEPLRGLSLVPPSGAKRVLIVDDEDGARDALAHLLEGEGYDVVTAENGRAAIDVLRGLGPDPFCIVLDLVMPEMDGVQFLERRRLDPVMSRIPVIIAAGQSSRSLSKSYARTSWLEKPIVLTALLEQLEMLLSHSSERAAR